MLYTHVRKRSDQEKKGTTEKEKKKSEMSRKEQFGKANPAC